MSLGTLNLCNYAFGAVNHLDYLGVQVTWISGSWFLSIFVNMLPWETGEELCCYKQIFIQVLQFLHLQVLVTSSLSHFK